MVIVQIKYVKNSTNYLRKTDYLSKSSKIAKETSSGSTRLFQRTSHNFSQLLLIIYKATIKSNLRTYHEKIYYGISEGTFKQPYGDHEKSLNHEKYRAYTELSKEYWRLKELKAQLQVQFYILKRSRPIKRIGICYLCLNDKIFIIEHQRTDLLNQRNGLISKCRHRNKFKLMNHKT